MCICVRCGCGCVGMRWVGAFMPMPSVLSLLLALQARTTDWQNGALTAEYFVQRLQETTQLLADYEALVPPPGWTYVWDRWVNILIGFITSCHIAVM